MSDPYLMANGTLKNILGIDGHSDLRNGSTAPARIPGLVISRGVDTVVQLQQDLNHG